MCKAILGTTVIPDHNGAYHLFTEFLTATPMGDVNYPEDFKENFQIKGLYICDQILASYKQVLADAYLNKRYSLRVEKFRSQHVNG
ncbi:MAG: hypothetical protein EOP00_12520 [Pedobacter sp.]|nr:MAG: hypothetical protein EOP00_12520 [Pedobacter sp.]